MCTGEPPVQNKNVEKDGRVRTYTKFDKEGFKRAKFLDWCLDLETYLPFCFLKRSQEQAFYKRFDY